MPEMTDDEIAEELRTALAIEARSVEVTDAAARVARARVRSTRGRRVRLPAIVELSSALIVAILIGGAFVAWRSQSEPGLGAVPNITCATPSARPSGASFVSPEFSAGMGRFSSTGTMTTPREGQTATLLPDGKVLIAGGYDNGLSLASAELYDPAIGRFSATGSMSASRYYHTATLLCDGLILIAGGQGGGNSAELYSPTTGAFSPTGPMTAEREGQIATLLRDGSVLIAGGPSNASAEVYDPKTGTFTATGSMKFDREFAATVLLRDGRVLVVGGLIPGPTPAGISLASAELYDPGTGTFTLTGSMNAARQSPTATLLPDGRVLIVGGGQAASAELYDPGTGTFSLTGSMTAFRLHATATLLPDGQVLIVGGAGGLAGTTSASTLASAELY